MRVIMLFRSGAGRRAALMFPAVSSNNVDLPMPGSPAMSTTEPGTMPPPSTRSNSPKPVGSLLTVSVEMLVIGFAALCTFCTETGVREVRPGTGVRAPVAAGASWNSSMVPHWPHSGHRPYHLPPLQPHSVHT